MAWQWNRGQDFDLSVIIFIQGRNQEPNYEGIQKLCRTKGKQSVWINWDITVGGRLHNAVMRFDSTWFDTSEFSRCRKMAWLGIECAGRRLCKLALTVYLANQMAVPTHYPATKHDRVSPNLKSICGWEISCCFPNLQIWNHREVLTGWPLIDSAVELKMRCELTLLNLEQEQLSSTVTRWTLSNYVTYHTCSHMSLSASTSFHVSYVSITDTTQAFRRKATGLRYRRDNLKHLASSQMTWRGLALKIDIESNWFLLLINATAFDVMYYNSTSARG